MKIVSVGEVMVELASADDVWLQSYGGDTFNTAIYLAREGQQVEYMTALGDDRFSEEIISRLQNENINTSLIRQCEGRQPGLYTIHNDSGGEREFSYWRQNSPARELFEQPAVLNEVPDVFYFSGITLAVMKSGFDNLLSLIAELKSKGSLIAFDPNYRAALWKSPEETQDYYRQIYPLCQTVLPTLDDEKLLWGLDSVQSCHEFYAQYGVEELVIKADGPSCHVFRGNDYFQQQAIEVKALDTTGAGDSFNAGYLASRCKGESIDVAVTHAQKLSSLVVQHRGAVIPRQNY